MRGEVRYSELKRVSIVTIVVNVLLAVIKVIAGIIFASMAVVSDGIHTISDVGTTIMVMIGLRFSSEAPDAKHPYGHERIESIISLFLAIILILLSCYLFYTGIVNIVNEFRPEYSVVAIIVTALSIAVKEWMYHYTKAFAVKHDSPSLLADAWHHRSDCFSSIAVLVGLLVGKLLDIWFAEAAATILLTVIIVYQGLKLLRTSVEQLIDKSADKEVVSDLCAIAMKVGGVLEIESIKTRKHASGLYVDLEVIVGEKESLTNAHKIAHNVHDRIEETHKVKHCMVHVSPKT